MKLTLTFLILSSLSMEAATRLSKTIAKPLGRGHGVTAAAATPRPAIITQTSDTATPWIVNGDGLRTRITLVNLENTAATYQLVFVTGDGFQFHVPWAGMDAINVLRGTIQPNSTLDFVSNGEGELAMGWSLASATGARVVFTAQNERLQEDGSWHSSTYYPANSFSKKIKVRFDNREGYGTTVVFNNMNTSGTDVTITVRDADGNEIGYLEGFMDSANQYGIDMAGDFPSSAGLQGTVEISIPTSNRSGVSALGVRMNLETGGVDLIDAFSTVAWSQ